MAVKEKSEEAEKIISDLTNEFPREFSDDLGQSTKTEVRFELKDNVTSIQSKKECTMLGFSEPRTGTFRENR